MPTLNGHPDVEEEMWGGLTQLVAGARGRVDVRDVNDGAPHGTQPQFTGTARTTAGARRWNPALSASQSKGHPAKPTAPRKQDAGWRLRMQKKRRAVDLVENCGHSPGLGHRALAHGHDASLNRRGPWSDRARREPPGHQPRATGGPHAAIPGTPRRRRHPARRRTSSPVGRGRSRRSTISWSSGRGGGEIMSAL